MFAFASLGIQPTKGMLFLNVSYIIHFSSSPPCLLYHPPHNLSAGFFASHADSFWIHVSASGQTKLLKSKPYVSLSLLQCFHLHVAIQKLLSVGQEALRDPACLKACSLHLTTKGAHWSPQLISALGSCISCSCWKVFPLPLQETRFSSFKDQFKCLL